MFWGCLYLANEVSRLYLGLEAFEVEAWIFYNYQNLFMGESVKLWLCMWGDKWWRKAKVECVMIWWWIAITIGAICPQTKCEHFFTPSQNLDKNNVARGDKSL